MNNTKSRLLVFGGHEWAYFLVTYLMTIMATYLTGAWELSITHASQIINLYSGTVVIMPVMNITLRCMRSLFFTLLVSKIAFVLGVGTKRIIGVCTKTEKYLFMSFEDVKDEMKSFILTQLQGLQELLGNRNVKEVLNLRGRHALEYRNCSAKLDWSVTCPKLPFHKSILYWHIATDICYYEDLDIIGSEEAPRFQRLSKLLSDYMAYILVMRPFMLTKGIRQISVRDTCSHAISFFKERRRSIHNQHDARRLLMKEGNVKTEDAPPSEWKKSVLAEGCKLAEELQWPDIENGWRSLEEKWGMIAKVWVEILCYAASDCGWEHQAQQLRRGGELLTHISLLMAHLGLSEQLPPSSKRKP